MVRTCVRHTEKRKRRESGWSSLMRELRDLGATLPLHWEPMAVMDTLPPAIILVDDEPDLLTILHRLLRDLSHNHALIAVSSGQAALELLSLCQVALLITDFNMLGMDGLQLITATKQTSPQTRTVLITACDSAELRRRVRTSPVDHYLAKPFSLEQLEQIARASVT
jgi:two-component system, response regulator, stage 0 sporulation protein F